MKKKELPKRQWTIIESCEDHPNGCYIRFLKDKAFKSIPREDCVIDYNEKGEIIGIEFYDGL